MRGLFHVCALALVCMAMADDPASQNTTNVDPSVPDPSQYPYFSAGPLAVLPVIQMQQHMSQKYGNLLIEVQRAMGWLQVAQGWLSMSMMEAQASEKKTKNFEEEGSDFEEDEDLEESMDLEEENPEQQKQYDALESSTETTLLYVLKLDYLRAGNMLNQAHQSHYQTKIQLALLQGAGATHLYPLLQVLYIVEAMKLMRSAIVIQRQDAWNTWLLHEIMETNEFDNSRSGLPAKFDLTMKHSRSIAMHLAYSESLFDFQIIYLEFYAQSYLMQIMATMGAIPQGASNSFLEVEASAEPNKPFMPFMMGGMHPQYMGYWTYYLKWMSAMMGLQAFQGLMMHAEMDLHPSSDGSSGKYLEMVKVNAIYAVQQYAYLRTIEVMIQLYGLFTGNPMAAHANAAASNSLLQTEAPNVVPAIENAPRV